jgi:hypothetical protein
MAKPRILTAARLREMLHYNPKTGQFSRLKPVKGRRPKVGSIGTTWGYHLIGIDWHQYHAHRLAWLWMTGEWPKYGIDHINRNRLDNRWSNLRDVPHRVNQANKGIMKTNTSGVVGVSWSNKGYWLIHFAFRTKKEAVKAAKMIRSMQNGA